MIRNIPTPIPLTADDLKALEDYLEALTDVDWDSLDDYDIAVAMWEMALIDRGQTFEKPEEEFARGFDKYTQALADYFEFDMPKAGDLVERHPTGTRDRVEAVLDFVGTWDPENDYDPSAEWIVRIRDGGIWRVWWDEHWGIWKGGPT